MRFDHDGMIHRGGCVITRRRSNCVDTLQIIVCVALGVFLLEGFTLAVFPAQVQRLLTEADPRALQIAGLLESLLAVGLLAALLAQ
jgi:uncharacterized protein YjeT (DUF2065 family)